MPFYIIYTYNNKKWLDGARKPEIPCNKFNRPAFRRGHKISQKEKKGENKVEIYICFETRELVLILIIISEICL